MDGFTTIDSEAHKIWGHAGTQVELSDYRDYVSAVTVPLASEFQVKSCSFRFMPRRAAEVLSN